MDDWSAIEGTILDEELPQEYLLVTNTLDFGDIWIKRICIEAGSTKRLMGMDVLTNRRTLLELEERGFVRIVRLTTE